MKRLLKPEDVVAYQRELQARPKSEIVIRVCSTGCRARGALAVCDAFSAEVEKRRLHDRVRVLKVGCHGMCSGAVLVVVDPGETLYQKVTPEDVPSILDAALKHKVVKKLCWSSNGTVTPKMTDVPFYKNQVRNVLQNCGVLDPRDIEDSIAHGGYQALVRVLTTMTPDKVVDEVTKSGLRGRGGAGFPTGKKWSFVRAEKSDVKYLICNGDEGQPGAFMDRAVLEADPHLVLEGMLIGAYAIGAKNGIAYVRAEYPIAVEHVILGIQQAREVGLLGKNILGTGLDFDVEVRMGAGAFVCGEETALIASVEGRRGMPRPRPPFPAQSGLFGQPTCINNVETFANVPSIILKGAGWYASMGTERSKGTKIFSLSGKVNNTGVVEIPLGTPLKRIIFDIGGGIPKGKEFKAAQIGGPSGGCVPKAHQDVPVDYESLTELGAIMGSGGLIVMDEDTCMVDMARHFLNFAQNESCGKCSPCRLGTRRMLEIVMRICEGMGQEDDIETLNELAKTIKDTSLCGLGQTAPNPVLSTIRHFRDEYEAHIREKRCPAGVCKTLIR